MNKLICGAVGALVCIVLAFAVCMQFAHKLDSTKIAVVQSMFGDLDVRRSPGWWLQCCPTITEYDCGDTDNLSIKDGDELNIQFNNKSKAKLEISLGYMINKSDDATLIKMHRQVCGNETKLWDMILAKVNTTVQSISTKYDPSDVIGGNKFDAMCTEMSKAIEHDPELLANGIDITVFNVKGLPVPDPDTKKQFDQQREADLAKRLAAAKVKQLEAETEQERAEANRKTEHEKIAAQAQMAKEKLDAERQKQNETIAAEKKLALAQIAKKEAEVKAQQEAEVAKINIEREKTVAEVQANKVLAVAEIQKKTEAANLEKEKLISEQIKVAAEAKRVQIEKSGAITESEKIKLDIDMQTKIGVARAYAEGIGKIKLPTVMNNGTGSAGPSDALKTFFDLKNAAMAIEMTEQPATKIPVKK